MERYKEMCTLTKSKMSHEKLERAQVTKDQHDVQAIKDQCQDPFDIETVPSSLVHITTGQVASKDFEVSVKRVP